MVVFDILGALEQSFSELCCHLFAHVDGRSAFNAEGDGALVTEAMDLDVVGELHGVVSLVWEIVLAFPLRQGLFQTVCVFARFDEYRDVLLQIVLVVIGEGDRVVSLVFGVDEFAFLRVLDLDADFIGSNPTRGAAD